MLRPALQSIVDELLGRVPAGGDVSLDDIGDALGTTAASHDEIDELVTALETAGRRVTGPEGGGGEDVLRRVLDAARAFRVANGRAPTAPEIAERTGIPLERVRHALALGRVIGR